MIETIQKATHGFITKAMKEMLHRDRRNYGFDIRLWNDRDPRVDQSFFQGSVPGFVLGVDQTIVDWNIGFEMVFGHHSAIKRGVNVARWYELIENFRRLPNREEKLHGEAMLPITDRERVVYTSPQYGRMVFMKIMSPVLDRHSGRIIGWNIALNINSVHERVKFFSDLNDRIQLSSRHARHIIGIDQVAMKSKFFQDVVQNTIAEIGSMDEVLFIGALGAGPFIEEVLTSHPNARVAVLDNDTEALRHLRHSLGRHGARVRLVRRAISDVKSIPENRFDTAIILWPVLSNSRLRDLESSLKSQLRPGGKIGFISWVSNSGSESFLGAVRRDLESRHEVDVVRWHMNLMTEEFMKTPAHCLSAESDPSGSGLGLRLIRVEAVHKAI